MPPSHPSHNPPRAVAVWLVLTNLVIAGLVVFALTQIDEPIAYVAGAPLVLACLALAGAYTWLLFRPTSRSRSRGSPE